MMVRSLPFGELRSHLGRGGLVLDTGAFRVHLRSNVERLVGTLASTYAHHPIELEPAVHHARIEISQGTWRGPARDRGVRALVNGRQILGPFPTYLAFPMLESVLNWCIAKDTLRYVVFHAGAVERGGRALVLTGPSGSGKSTLGAALSQTGWRLLSDELMLLRPAGSLETGPAVVANPRPISLKNEAIARIRDLAPSATFTDAYEGTVRGTIAFLCPSAKAVARGKETASPSRVIFPTFRAGADAQVTEIEKAAGFMRLVENSVNYATTLRAGFDAVAGLTDLCRFYELTFGDLGAALAKIGELEPGDAAAA